MVVSDSDLASLSLDLDNLWSYLKTRDEPGWESLPSYLEVAIPRILRLLEQQGVRITVFVVGQDAAREENRSLLAALVAAGHEIGNHSFRHDQWLHLYRQEEIDDELARAEAAIEEATGVRPQGFRGPGFALSLPTLQALARRRYRYDASTLPTYLGPLARAYYFRRARMSQEERRRRRLLFGTLGEGLRPLEPYRWRLDEGSLIELPVTTMPFFRTPIHASYCLYLATVSPLLARFYWRLSLRLCRWCGIQPSILLHPLDFLGCDDTGALSFFPAMRRTSAWKLEQMGHYLATLCRLFRVLPIGEHLDRLELQSELPERQPRFHPSTAPPLPPSEAR